MQGQSKKLLCAKPDAYSPLCNHWLQMARNYCPEAWPPMGVQYPTKMQNQAQTKYNTEQSGTSKGTFK